jgi:hypothetical protein
MNNIKSILEKRKNKFIFKKEILHEK